MADTSDLAGRTVVVTGTTSGIGRGTALRLGACGANVVAAARRHDALTRLTDEIRDAGGRATPVVTDVSDPEQVARLAEAAIEAYGDIDVWVNNVGIGALGYFWDIPVEDHARVVEVNLTGLMYGAHVALRHFLSRGHGILVNIGSVESELPLALQSSYAATKAGVLSLGRSLNEELRLAGKGDTIRVGTVLPWAVDTPWWHHAANYTGHAPRMIAMDDASVAVDAVVAACIDPHEAQGAGWKARGALTSNRVAPGASDRLSADVVFRTSENAPPAEATTGSIHDPLSPIESLDGGIRERMQREKARDR